MAWRRLGAQIVAQANDTDVMLADVQAGVYYTIAGSGTEMWNAIELGFSRDQIVRRLESIYEAPAETLDSALTDFVDNLVDFDLIKPSSAQGEAKSAPQAAQATKRPFVAPVVSKVDRSDPQLFELSKTIRWQPASPEVAWKCEEQEATLVQVYKGVLYNLGGTARDIWLGLGAGCTRKALIDLFSSRFAVSAQQITSDIDRFIADLVQLSLIQPADCEQTEIGLPAPLAATVWEAPHMVATEDRQAALKWISTSKGWEQSAPRIVAEVIDDEVVIVDLAAGIYSSITGAGTAIWPALSGGQRRDDLVRSLQEWFEISSEEAADEVDSLVADLAECGLIRPRKSDETPQWQGSVSAHGQKVKFERSQITRHHDMEDALRLDPVHDFDEYGWPNRA